MNEYPNYVTKLECSLTGDTDYDTGNVHSLSRVGRPLVVGYDLDKIKTEIDRDRVAVRPGGFWKWRELLPVMHEENVIRLGEEDTPLIPFLRMPALSGATGRLVVKDESRLPTGSFKARGLALAVAKAKELGLKRLAMPTNGNAGAALGAYASRAGLESFVFCPDVTPDPIVREIALQGAKVWRVNGLIHHCSKLVKAGEIEANWFDFSTMKEPYRLEGKKTMGLELAAQMNWSLPDAIFYPTGGGTGLIGMWKAFKEMKALGWITGALPKMIAVQSSGCAPIVKAYDEGSEFAEEWQNASTHASGIRVSVSVADFMILRAVRESGGFAISVPDEIIEAARIMAGRTEGVHLGPEGAATLAAYGAAIDDGRLEKDADTVLYNCGTGLKYPMPDAPLKVDRFQDIDFKALVS